MNTQHNTPTPTSRYPASILPASTRGARRQEVRFPWLAAMALGLAGLMTGCLPSLRPIYTEKDLIYDAGLVGTWKEEAESEEGWTFAKGEEEGTYLVTVVEDGRKSPFTGRLAKFQGQRFLDLVPHKDGLEALEGQGFYRSGLVRCHLFLRVDEIGSELRMRMMNVDWVIKLVEEDPRAIAHYREGDEVFLLTATTPELQAFLIRHLNTEKAWENLAALRKNPDGRAAQR